ncbi:MAG TPA: hydroxymethylbilane synthase, partial [Longimicrobiales bacterium]|nr:hydroxymethylbilane synthase [Longimicrobiales bacterium]
DALPGGARVGTSSLRRRAQLLARRPDLVVEDLRGNLDTRLARVADGDYDAAILAAAGILRLGRDEAIGQRLDPADWLPAVGQGALGIAIREGDSATRSLVAPLDDAGARAATTAERAFLNELEGGCQVPIGAMGSVAGGALRLDGLVASLDGTTVLRAAVDGKASAADQLGRKLAALLLERGAGDVLARVRAAAPFRGPGAP